MSRLRALLLTAFSSIVVLGCQEDHAPPGVPDDYRWLYDMSVVSGIFGTTIDGMNGHADTTTSRGRSLRGT